MTLDNGLSVANDWDNDGRLASRRLYQTSGGTNLSYLSYPYDANDNIGAIRDDRVAMTSGTGTRRFVYDADGRVMGEYGVSAADVIYGRCLRSRTTTARLSCHCLTAG